MKYLKTSMQMILVLIFSALLMHSVYADDASHMGQTEGKAVTEELPPPSGQMDPAAEGEAPPIGQSEGRPLDSPEIGEAPPIGQSAGMPIEEDEGISGDVFGDQGGRFHPFLVLEEIYTDNLFATHTDEKSDFITSITPGIWLAFPANREKLLSMDTTTTAPGGLKLSRIKPETTRRYQTYFLYAPEFVLYSSNSDHNHVNQTAEGLFQYNLDSGISFDFIDIFHDREEISGNGITDTLYRHQDNLFDFIASYTSRSEKLKLQLQYSNYYLEYEEREVQYRDRDDNSLGASLFYKFWPKTSLFAEYDYSDIEFDTASRNDSVENRFYVGVNWDITAKTRGTFKFGYMDKNFDQDDVEDQSGPSFELQTQHNLNPKRALQINAYRNFNESDMAVASSFLSTGIDVGLMQRFREKWSGTLNVVYENNDYNGIPREDDLFGIGPAIRFEPKKWLNFDLGYFYYRNKSTQDFYDYTTNEIFLRANLSM